MQTKLIKLVRLTAPVLPLLLASACSGDDNGQKQGSADDVTDEGEEPGDEGDDDKPTGSVDSGTRRDSGVDATVRPPSGDAGPDDEEPDTTVDGGPGGGGKPDGSTDPGTKPPVTGGGACLDGITDFKSAGPFKYAAKPSGAIKMWIPEVPAGCKVPVIHLANGTGASCSAYQNVINRFASHGFLTTCYENTNTGAGTQGLQALQKAVELYPELADKRFGSTGHSQGGQAAFVVLQLAEAAFGDDAVYAGLAMQPASGFGSQPSGGSWQSVYAKIKSPMFAFSGTADTLVSASWVQRGYDALADSIEAYNWSASGATHIPTPQAETMEVGVPWFRWKLLGDKAACEAFKALPGAGRWREVAAQNKAECQ